MSATNNWQTALLGSYERLNQYLVDHIPHVVGAIFLIVIGLVIAWLLSKLALSLVKLSARLWQKILHVMSQKNKPIVTKNVELKPLHSMVISRTVFWLVMLFFITAASSSLGLDIVSSWLNSLISFVPQIVATILIVIAGYLLGNIAGIMVESAAKNTGFAQASTTGNIVKTSIFFVAIVIGSEQLGINVYFITTFIIVVAGVMLFGIALAFGLGSATYISNILAAKQYKNQLHLREYVKFGDVEGVLVAVTPTMLILETESGRTLLPANVCMQSKLGVAIVVEQK